MALLAGDRPFGRRLPYGSVTLYDPADPVPLRRRLADLDPDGRLALLVERDGSGRCLAAWTRAGDGPDWVGILPGGSAHPLWGPSDRIVGWRGAGAPEALTVSAAVNWDALSFIPPVADPMRLPGGAGSALLNLLAGLASDQGAARLRYRGPYPTEQLFWSLAESFRPDPLQADPLACFIEEAEETFRRGESREAPLDWTPAPHETRVGSGDAVVTLRDGVEKVVWEARAYHRVDGPIVARRTHRVVRRLAGHEGPARYLIGLQALGHVVEDHLALDAAGRVVERFVPAPDEAPPPTGPIEALWREALSWLLPLEATPLLGPAIAAVWPGLEVSWRGVRHDLVATEGAAIHLSAALPARYRDARRRCPVAGRRALAQALVREVLGLLGDPVRAAAAAWLDAEPPSRQQSLLGAVDLDRRAMAGCTAGPLRRLLDALEAGRALPG